MHDSLGNGPSSRSGRFFLVERDLPGMSVADLRLAQKALQESSRLVTRAGQPVRYLRSTLVHGTARCFCLFEAAGREAVKLANETAQVPFSRIDEAFDLAAPDRRHLSVRHQEENP
jgi:hypothetical protein